jgi:hypothetical protein
VTIARRELLGSALATAGAMIGRRAFGEMPTTATRVIGGAGGATGTTGEPAAETTRLEGQEANRVARWLGGLDPLPTADAPAEWKAYAAQQDTAWRSTAGRVRALQAWSSRELLPLLPAGRPLLYPFSGPDALHAIALFADRPKLVLVGLEPVRPLPDPARVPDGYFDQLGSSLVDLHRLAFFRTRIMATDFDDDGVAGALAATLARLGGVVTLIETGTNPGRARLTWTNPSDPPTHAPRQLEYTSVDLSNVGLVQRHRFFADLAAGGPFVTFLKSASFLLGEPRFTQTTQWLLEQSAVLVQDDSGVPFHQLEHGWALRFFGRYVPPGHPFADRAQPALAAAFARRTPSPLPFSFGYHTTADHSHLLVASKEH